MRQHHELIVHMPAQRAYANFLQAMDTNEVMSNCKLTETESGGVIVRLWLRRGPAFG